MIKRLVFVLAALSVIGVAPVQARTLTKMLADSGLTPEDIDMMSGEAASLYTSASRRTGDKAEWKNDSSGAFGSVKIIAIEGKCITLDHVFKTRKNRDFQSTRTRRCQAADGSWQLE